MPKLKSNKCGFRLSEHNTNYHFFLKKKNLQQNSFRKLINLSLEPDVVSI